MMKYTSLLSTASLMFMMGQSSFASGSSTAEVDKEGVPIISAEEASLQKLFLLGVFALEQKDYQTSIAIFSDITRRTNSPRVRLELARSFFLDRQFKASKRIFQEILSEKSVPWGVKQNIRLYLNQIDHDIGYMKFGISFVSDSNPENFTSSEEVNIFGRVLKVVQPSSKREVMGVRYSMNGALPLSTDARTQAYVNASFSDFEGGTLERWVSDVGVSSTFKQLPRVGVQAGLEYSEQNGQKRYDFAYLNLRYTPNIIDQFRYDYQLRLGKLSLAGAPHLDADVYRATTNFTRSLQNDAFVEGSVAFEKSVARETPYSYHEGALALGVDFPINNWGVKFSSSVGLRLYAANDPFFGDRRRDVKKKFGVMLSNKKIHTYGYKPEVGIVYEQNESSLAFFEYDKVSLVFSLIESY